MCKRTQQRYSVDAGAIPLLARLLPLAGAVMVCAVGLAQESPGGLGSVVGKVVITRRLTRTGPIPTIPPYQRGRAVALRAATPIGVPPVPADKGDWLGEELSRVVVWLEGSDAGGLRFGEQPGSHPPVASIQQIGRRFWPDVLAIPAGGEVSFPNMDPIFHNIFSLSRPKSFDLGNYPKGDTRRVVFPKPGIVFVNCHLHPNMAAVIVVAPNDRVAKLDTDGKFSFEHLPPGDYVIVAWHKVAGTIRKKVHVEGTGEVGVEFSLPGDAMLAANSSQATRGSN